MRRYTAEFIGTFVLVFGGVGAAVIGGDRIGNVGIALAFGFAVLAMAYSLGSISGAHLNPAVSLGMFLSNRMERRHLGGYIAAQIIGAIVAAGLLLLVAKGALNGYEPTVAGFGANGYREHSPGGYGALAAFVAEVVLTFFLVFTVLSSTDEKAPAGFAGIPVGLMLALVHLIGIPVTGTSVNPARSIGPAIFVGGWATIQLWLFIVAPLIGAFIAAFTYRFIHANDSSDPDETRTYRRP